MSVKPQGVRHLFAIFKSDQLCPAIPRFFKAVAQLQQQPVMEVI